MTTNRPISPNIRDIIGVQFLNNFRITKKSKRNFWGYFKHIVERKET